MERQAAISADVLARYAADAALEVDGVARLADGPLPRASAVAVAGIDDVAVSVMLELDWGSSAVDVDGAVQRRVSEYLSRMADVTPGFVDVTFSAVGPPPSRT